MPPAPDETPSSDRRSFRLAYAPGVTPAKWVGVWRERLPDVDLVLVPVDALDGGAALREDRADAGLLRMPVPGDDVSMIPLYTEVPVVVVGKEHAIAAFADIAVSDLEDEVLLRPLDESLEWPELPGQPATERPASTGDAVELVAAGVGVVVVPQSVARLHHRKDVTYRPVTDGPGSRVGLAWLEGRSTDLVEEMVGIVRGRTANSSRGRSKPDAAPTTAEPRAATKNSSAPPSKAQLKSAAARLAADRKAAFERKSAARTGAKRGGKPSIGKRGKR
ncbi:LysR substrate-binding domain-containing protein [Sanguibacter antarcticus]|uniref:LysR substrate binding domain-containing protein n=1 Tax=Sanguibacter antarcticus TaxID=372484 RepID=A0A2A9E2P4_9MICO|nr:LysR substrate-binding domain-containing protein [Sanguibacter antarcticus]PFG32460.1 LysR substrate binding domain-containing protein [Sanguibacter antarcticus]